MLIATNSFEVHERLLRFLFVPDRSAERFLCTTLDVRPHGGRVEWPGNPQSPGERATALGHGQAGGSGV
jgi:hypothetical protein